MKLVISIVLALCTLSSYSQEQGRKEQPTQHEPYFPGCEPTSSDAGENCTKQQTARFIRETILCPYWPDEEFKTNTTYVSYQIDPDGWVQHVEIYKSGGKQLDEAAVTAVKKLPQHTSYTPEKEGEWAEFVIPVRASAQCIRKRENFKE